MARSDDDDEHAPPSPSTASSSDSLASFDSDADDEKRDSGRTNGAGGEKQGVSPVIRLVIGIAVTLLVGPGVYLAVEGFPMHMSEAGSATSDASSSSTPAPSTTVGDDDSRAASPIPANASSPSSPSTSHPSSSSTSADISSLPPLVGTSLLVDFSTYTGSSAADLSSFLSSHGLRVSTSFIESSPVTHTFMKENIGWKEGALSLKVTGQTAGGKEDVKSAEFSTTDSILYGMVTTRARASPVEGVCHGFFYYADDNHEVDIELLSSFYTKGKGDAVAAGCQFTNQALVPGDKVTSKAVPYGFDPTTDFHDYTIEWTADATTFSLDGEVVATLTENVPTTPMPMVWNSWSSGGENWSAGPPTEDSYLLIAAIAANWTVAEGSSENGAS
ncbi:hypothetical protein JCM11251_008009 [Rhodosporidiobolus azoricus]